MNGNQSGLVAQSLGWVPSLGNPGQSLAESGWGDAWKMASISDGDGRCPLSRRQRIKRLIVRPRDNNGPTWAGLGKPIPGVPGTFNHPVRRTKCLGDRFVVVPGHKRMTTGVMSGSGLAVFRSSNDSSGDVLAIPAPAGSDFLFTS